MARGTRILLAGSGGPFAPEVLDEAVRLAEERDAKVSVLQVLRVWGTSLGLAHPALKPNAREQRLRSTRSTRHSIISRPMTCKSRAS